MRQSLYLNLVYGICFGRFKSFPRLAKELCDSLCKGLLWLGLIIVILLPTLAYTEHVLSTLLIITGLYPWFMGVWGTIWLINGWVSDVIAGRIECLKRAFTRSTIKSLCLALCGRIKSSSLEALFLTMVLIYIGCWWCCLHFGGRGFGVLEVAHGPYLHGRRRCKG